MKGQYAIYDYMKQITTIQLRLATRNRLRDAASKSETYDDFLNKLLDSWEQQIKRKGKVILPIEITKDGPTNAPI